MHNAMSGAVLMGYWAIGLIFHQFYRKKRDRLFAFFACAFWLLAFERILLLMLGPRQEFSVYVYLVRLLAFGCMLFAIYDKNKGPARG